MQLSTSLNRLSRNDSKLIGRDSMLVGLSVYIFLIAVILRFALPWLNDFAAEREFGIVIADFYPLLVAYIALFTGTLIGGMVNGFLMLDERDHDTLKALLVTPMPINHYTAYRIIMPTLISFVVILAEMAIINLALIDWGQMTLIAAVAALNGAVVALILGTFGENKVQGFAVMKIISSSGLVLFAAWFIQGPLATIVGVYPAYWPVKAYWLALNGDPSWWVHLAIGVVYFAIVIGYLVRRFAKIAYK